MDSQFHNIPTIRQKITKLGMGSRINAYLCLAKNREGTIGEVWVLWDSGVKESVSLWDKESGTMKSQVGSLGIVGWPWDKDEPTKSPESGGWSLGRGLGWEPTKSPELKLVSLLNANFHLVTRDCEPVHNISFNSWKRNGFNVFCELTRFFTSLTRFYAILMVFEFCFRFYTFWWF